MKVQDVIAGQQLVIANATQPLSEIAQLMSTHGVTGIPVVDEWGVLAGLVTVSRIMEIVRGEGPTAHELPTEISWSPGQQSGPSVARWKSLPARDAMVSDLVTVEAEADLRDAARSLVNRGVHRAVVLGKDRNVKGVLSALDFALLVAEGKLHE